MLLSLLSEGAEGPNTTLAWILYSGLGFFFLMIMAGWLTSLRKRDQPTVRPEADKSRSKKEG